MTSQAIIFKTPLNVIPEEELEKTRNFPHYTGGFGDVWQCTWSPPSGKPPVLVAVKVLKVSDSTKTAPLEQTKRGIRREAYVWANLEDDHILSLHGITTADSAFGVLPAFVSPWMTRGSLDSYLKENPTLSTFEKLDMSQQIASGLKYLHEKEKPIVHGDLTPTNVLINSDNKLCLADFGLSMVLPESGNPTFNSCHEGNVWWMAPEMVALPPPEQGPVKPTMPGDIYSLGCIVLQLLCGRRPYHTLMHAIYVVAAVLTGREPFDELTDIDEGHKQYLLTCLSTDVGARPVLVQEIIEFIVEAKLQISDGQ